MGNGGRSRFSPVYGTLNPERKIFESLQKDLGIKIALEKISSDEGEGRN